VDQCDNFEDEVGERETENSSWESICQTVVRKNSGQKRHFELKIITSYLSKS